MSDPLKSEAATSERTTGRVAGLQRSAGGVPKLAIDGAAVRFAGMEGDWQRNRKYHGGPDRALCLYSMELIEALAAEGHAIVPGALGENVTLSGLPWKDIILGARLHIGTVDVQVTAFAEPCRQIEHVFQGRRIGRVAEKVNPGWSRVYARVLREGKIQVGDAARVLSGGGEEQLDQRININ